MSDVIIELTIHDLLAYAQEDLSRKQVDALSKRHDGSTQDHHYGLACQGAIVTLLAGLAALSEEGETLPL